MENEKSLNIIDFHVGKAKWISKYILAWYHAICMTRMPIPVKFDKTLNTCTLASECVCVCSCESLHHFSIENSITWSCWRIIRYLNKVISITIICTSPSNDVAKKTKDLFQSENRKTSHCHDAWCSTICSIHTLWMGGRTIHQTIFYFIRNSMHHTSEATARTTTKAHAYTRRKIDDSKHKME